MAGKIQGLREALGLTATASLAEVRASFDRMLMDGMTPEEKARMEEEQRQAQAAQTQMQDAAAGWAQLRALLGLGDDATAEQVLEAVRALKGPGDMQMAEVPKLRADLAAHQLEVRKLSEQLAELKPMAEKAERLEKAARLSERTRFFDDQVRAGKVAPADRAFFEQLWDNGQQEKVREYFKDRKPIVNLDGGRLSLVPSPGGDGATLDDDTADPRDVLLAKATELAKAEGVALSEAHIQAAKVKHPELVQRIGAMYGPGGALARR